jgi:homoserine dehydrogenase
MAETKLVRIGLLGCGTVGGATARLLRDHQTEIAQRTGAKLELARVAVRDPGRPREVDLPPSIVTSDGASIVEDPNIDLVVETIGGIDPARDLIGRALRNGKHVVTANKELLASHGTSLMSEAARNDVDLLFEASVGGGIPIVRNMKEALAGDRVRRVMGIVNGTTNFILTRMSEAGLSFADALAEADSLGYTEADPSADIDGHDAAAKIAILAAIAFEGRVTYADVATEGIRHISETDISAAHDLGYEVKLVAVAESDEGQVSARVHPAMLPKTHPLAAVRDVFNAVFVEGEEVGELMFLGRGAGGSPTATAVVADIVEVARNIVAGGRTPSAAMDRDLPLRPADQVRTRYYLRLSVADEPGALAAIAGSFARSNVSIASVRQEGRGDEATLVLITHAGTEGQHRATIDEIEALDVVKGVRSRIRVEGTAET